MLKHLTKFIAVVALPIGLAIADSWIGVADSSDGLRLVASIESIAMDKYNKDDGAEGLQASAVMKYIGKDPTPPFLSVIDVEECLTKNSGVLVVAFPDKTTQTYFWSDGKMMYDAQGQFLCAFIKEKYQQRKKPEGKKYSI